ncbi:MAG: M28 family peptidase [Acidobacteriota bacterium]
MKNYFKILVILTISLFVSISFFSCGNGNSRGRNTPLAEKLRNEVDALSKREMQSIFQFMGDDLFEGRAPGTRGGDLAEKYLRSVMKLMDIEPYGDSYLQPFTLNGFTTSELKVSAAGADLDYNGEVLGTYTGGGGSFNLSGKAVFIGYGTETELWNWDDFKGYDIKDKIVISRVNDPGMFIEDIFEGKILTYFGRWRYHIEEARRKGAKAIFLIHTDDSAGYGWNVVQNSWSGEELYLDSELEGNMVFAGWIKEDVLKRVLASSGHDLEKLYEVSLKRDFSPVPLNVEIEVSGQSDYRKINNNNVIGFIKGKSEKSIVLSAHIDHLGILSGKEGDNIFNGAIDNGTAVAAMMMTAKILKKFQKELKYSVIILGPNAEEGGLLGSRYFVETCDKSKIIANINFESTPVWGKSGSIMGVGARFSTMEDMLKEIASEEGLEYKYFSMSNQGFYFRSDQYPFATSNIPSLWISAGEDDDSGMNLYKKFWRERYHTVNDEYDPAWSLEGLRQTIKFALLLAEKIDSGKNLPEWKRQLTFPVLSEEK